MENVLLVRGNAALARNCGTWESAAVTKTYSLIEGHDHIGLEVKLAVRADFADKRVTNLTAYQSTGDGLPIRGARGTPACSATP